jgi:hypothetical protein
MLLAGIIRMKRGGCALTSEAYPRSAIEGNISPAWTEIGPSLWSEVICIVAEDVCPPVHGVAVPPDD